MAPRHGALSGSGDPSRTWRRPPQTHHAIAQRKCAARSNRRSCWHRTWLGRAPRDALADARRAARWIDFHVDFRLRPLRHSYHRSRCRYFRSRSGRSNSRRSTCADFWPTPGAKSSPSRARKRSMNVLVTAEIALALGVARQCRVAGQSLQKVLKTDPGFRAENVLTFSVSLPEPKYPKPEQRAAFFEDLLARLPRDTGRRVRHGRIAGSPFRPQRQLLYGGGRRVPNRKRPGPCDPERRDCARLLSIPWASLSSRAAISTLATKLPTESPRGQNPR